MQAKNRGLIKKYLFSPLLRKCLYVLKVRNLSAEI